MEYCSTCILTNQLNGSSLEVYYFASHAPPYTYLSFVSSLLFKNIHCRSNVNVLILVEWSFIIVVGSCFWRVSQLDCWSTPYKFARFIEETALAYSMSLAINTTTSGNDLRVVGFLVKHVILKYVHIKFREQTMRSLLCTELLGCWGCLE